MRTAGGRGLVQGGVAGASYEQVGGVLQDRGQLSRGWRVALYDDWARTCGWVSKEVEISAEGQRTVSAVGGPCVVGVSGKMATMVTVMDSVGGKFIMATAGSIAKMALKLRYGWRANIFDRSFLALYILPPAA